VNTCVKPQCDFYPRAHNRLKHLEKMVDGRCFNIHMAEYNDLLWFQQVFLNCTLIKNYETIDCKGRNPTDRGRSGTKLSAICDSDRVKLGMVPSPANVPDVHQASLTLLGRKNKRGDKRGDK